MNTTTFATSTLCVAALLLVACTNSNADKPLATSDKTISSQAAGIDAYVSAQHGANASLPVRGQIKADFDGEQYHWVITTLDDSSQFSIATADKNWQGGYSIHLRAQTQAGTGQAPTGVILEMSFTSSTLSAESTLSNAMFTLIPHAGLVPPHWVSPDQPQISIEHASFDGQRGRIEGRLTAVLCYRAELLSQPETDNCKPIQAQFATDLASDPDQL